MFYCYRERIIKEGEYIRDNGATVRATAKQFGVSKSCVHKDVNKKLKNIDQSLYREVKAVLALNFAQKHIRGGLVTQSRYKKASK